MPALLSVTLQPVWAEEEMLQSEDVNSEYGVELALDNSDSRAAEKKDILDVGAGSVTVGWSGMTIDYKTTDDSLIVGDKKDKDGKIIIEGSYDMVGYVKDGNFVSYDVLDDGTCSTTTKNLKVGQNGDKDLTIYGAGQVVLGGQIKGSVPFVGKYDFYSGITANKITVAGDGSVTNLEVSNAKLNELEVQSGKAVLHGGGNIRGGNDYHLEDEGGLNALTTDKQAVIRKKITVSGGDLQLGSDGSVTKQYLTAIGCKDSAATMIQSGDSTIGVYGYSIAQAGLTIVQAEGEMTFRDYLRIKGSGTNTIWQGYEYDSEGNLQVVTNPTKTATGEPVASKITFGNLGKGTFELNQANEGTLQIDNVETGSTFTINQSGTGSIVLGSGFDNATVTVSKSTGTLEFNSNVKLGSLTKDGGTIKVAENSTLTADSLNWNLEEKQTKDTGSDIEISGGVSLSNGELKTDGSTVTNTGMLSAGQIVVNGGTFINEGNINYTAPSALLALGSDEDNALLLLSGTTDASDVVVKGGDFVNIGNVGNVLVEEGGTLTMENQSSAGSIVMDGGRINVTGESSVGSLTLNGENNVINFDFSNGETAPSIVLNSGEALDLSATTIMVTVSTEMLENLAGQDFELFGGYVENITNATIIFTDGDDDTTNDKAADVTHGSTSGSIIVTNTHVVPEPTTATLSLLALVGLAARRRRK